MIFDSTQLSNCRLLLRCHSVALSSCSTGESSLCCDKQRVSAQNKIKSQCFNCFDCSYQFSTTTGFLIALTWCLVVCVSRIYLGMHSVAVSVHQNNKQHESFIYDFDFFLFLGCDCRNLIDCANNDPTCAFG